MKKRPRKKIVSTGKLVAINFQNGLGNFIMLTPAIKALCTMHEAKADIVLDDSWSDERRKSVEDLCNNWTLVNKVVKFDKDFSADKYCQLFYTRHGESSEAFYYFEKYAGYEASPVNWRAEKLNEVDSYMNEVYGLGYRGDIPSLYCPNGRASPIYTNPSNKDMLSLKIGLCNGLFAGSTWKWERKGWPYFGELIELLNRFFGHGKFRIFLFGKGKREKAWAEEMNQISYNVVDTVNRTSILETVQLLRQCHLFITTDTGLMHVADAHHVPMIVLFGATLISKNGPYNKEHRTIRSPLKCAPCQASPAFHVCNEWQCMDNLKPEMVMTEVREYIAQLVQENRIRANLAPIMRTKYDHWGKYKRNLQGDNYVSTNES